MIRVSPKSSSARIALICVILQLFWVAGLGVYTLCIEPDGAFHAEWSDTGCDTACGESTIGDTEQAVGLQFEAPPVCVDCTDLTVARAGFRTQQVTPGPVLALPVVPLMDFDHAPPRSVSAVAGSLYFPGSSSSGGPPLRC